ncbi:metallophosphoesterase [Tessaracoccus oleiagri]|uniref:3',5'-cyclic AMP phosphodiesterase CpdA n=1 Tax=Tessaracoccus oleiagri TaxID=686624 RepID=A0A1G9JES4_9ACTN|nr:metallophosphoesterase [Tessaracoccus oleiagri]SDL36079.1 3',5'-cyclic AMP phosphodiesterase CpdA [Tessaracoccus oleiagri]
MASGYSLLVLGDTQYLFDGDRNRPDLLAETFAEVARLEASGAISPVRHVVHVGDVTEHGWAQECSRAYRALAAGREILGQLAMTIATGNHDVEAGSRDDRGETPFLAAFGPASELLRGANLASAVVHGPGGYSSWRRVALPDGSELGVLALDWDPTDAGWRWAAETLTGNATVPTVVVCHDVAHDSALTQRGLQLEEALAGHSQVFLVLGGHHWPSTRVVTAGREYHAINYQELPFGGAGTARVYDFDPPSGTCQAITFSPALRHPDVLRSVAARRRLGLARPEDQFAFPLPAALGGGPDTPWQARGQTLVADHRGPGEIELALPGDFTIEATATLPERFHDSWQVLLARLGEAPDGSPEPLAALSLSTENFLGWMAYVEGGETWATSHEYAPGTSVVVVLSNRDGGGLWVDGDPVGRRDARLGHALVPGPWRWRVGSGEYAGASADPFQGTVTRVRAWSS